METHAKVVIIGGGVVGCSILFHLAKFGLRLYSFRTKRINFRIVMACGRKCACNLI